MNQITIFPNPISSVAWIESKVELTKHSLRNAIGQNFTHLITLDKIDSKHYTLDVKRLPSGKYILNTNTDSTEVFKK